jgi:hypothetical protein
MFFNVGILHLIINTCSKGLHSDREVQSQLTCSRSQKRRDFEGTNELFQNSGNRISRPWIEAARVELLASCIWPLHRRTRSHFLPELGLCTNVANSENE